MLDKKVQDEIEKRLDKQEHYQFNAQDFGIFAFIYI
jgi:hypothetical protein